MHLYTCMLCSSLGQVCHTATPHTHMANHCLQGLSPFPDPCSRVKAWEEDEYQESIYAKELIQVLCPLLC